MAVDSYGDKGQPHFDGTKASNLAADLNAVSDYASGLTQWALWGPALGGNAAAVGANGGSDGKWTVTGPSVRMHGRFVFGSGASFGTGSPTILGLPVNIDPDHATGTGFFRHASGGDPIPVTLVAGDNGMHILLNVAPSGGGVVTARPAWVLGNPDQSSVLIFTIDALTA